MKGLLKWPGGKAPLLDRILPLLDLASPERRLYLEPFLGSGVVAHAVAATAPPGLTMDLADANGELVDAHRAALRRPHDLAMAIGALPEENTPENYARVRAEFNAARGGEGGVDQAARLLWLNRACFNGLYRVNRDGGFNVPRGSASQVVVPSMVPYTAPFRAHQVSVSAWEWRPALGVAWAWECASIYLDPPYLPAAGGAFTSYGPDGAVWAKPEEHEALAKRGLELAARGARVVLSNALHDETRRIFSGWRLEWEGEVARRVGGRGDRRASAPEGLWVVGRARGAGGGVR